MKIKHSSIFKLLHGFTLIEFVIVFGIIGVMSGLALAHFNKFSDDTQLQNEARIFANSLSLAQKKGTAGDDMGCAIQPIPTPNLVGYRINMNSATTYRLQRECQSGVVTPLQSYTIGYPNINIIPAPGASTITFKILSNGIIPAAGTSIRVKHIVKNRCINIVVSPVGNITESQVYSGGGC